MKEITNNEWTFLLLSHFLGIKINYTVIYINVLKIPFALNDILFWTHDQLLVPVIVRMNLMNCFFIVFHSWLGWTEVFYLLYQLICAFMMLLTSFHWSSVMILMKNEIIEHSYTCNDQRMIMIKLIFFFKTRNWSNLYISSRLDGKSKF